MNKVAIEDQVLTGVVEQYTDAPAPKVMVTASDVKPIDHSVQPAITTHSLGLMYGGKPAFEDVSLSIRHGSITAIVGPSGCGKTSFLMCMNRLTDLIPGCRVSGRVCIDQADVNSPATDVVTLRRRVGMIFQKPNPFPLSIRRNIELPLREYGVRGRQELGQIVQGVLEDVGLWDEVKDRLDTSALRLSGGQQQRLCIARALALKPRVVLFDEPCSALDPISSGVVEDLIAGLRGRYTVVIVTHNLAQAARLADWVGVFWVRGGSGRLIEFGTSRQVFKQPSDPLTYEYVNGCRG